MSEKVEKELKALEVRRKQIQASINRFQSYLDSLKGRETILVSTLDRRLREFEPLLEKFNSIQSAMEGLDEKEFDSNIRQEVEDLYDDLIAKAREIKIAAKPPLVASIDISTHSSVVSNQDLAQSQLRLPKIELPKFNGNYDQWFPFFDTFKSLIHDKPEIGQIEKFHYLKSALQGDAKEILNSLEICAGNYEVAWDLLKSRYDNERIIVKNHVRAIFDLPQSSKESATILRKIVDGVQKHLQALRALKRPTGTWDDLLIHVIMSKVDAITSREWESKLSTEIPTLESLLVFLKQKCQMLESMASTKVENYNGRALQKEHKVTAHLSMSSQTCMLGHHDHLTQNCRIFLDMPVQKRLEEVRKSKFCANCLKSKHLTFKCFSKDRCTICNKKHHPLLHISEVSRQDGPPVNQSTNLEQQPTTSINNHCTAGDRVDSHILLSTAIVRVFDASGGEHLCRALLDSGSQSNFITSEFVQNLRLPHCRRNLPVIGISGASSIIKHSVKARVASRFNAFSAIIECLVLDKITGLHPQISLNRDSFQIPKNIKLADPKFEVSNKIDLLIGAEVFWKLLCIGQIKAHNNLMLQKTQLGWITTGKIDIPKPTGTYLCNFVSSDVIQSSVERFWELEELPKPLTLSPDENRCESIFQETTSRDKEGRFVVQLPFKEDPNKLGDSKEIAIKRFYGLERRLDRDPNLRRQYTDFMEEYLTLGHMKAIDEKNDTSSSNYYLPHHPVIKESSLTTRVRVVFDASCKATNGLSLNNVLLIGPTIQEDLFSIMVRFRMHQFVMTADITKMYRQVLINKNHRKYQRILWRNNRTEKIQTYELNTVTYGTAPASFLATRCLQQLAREAQDSFGLGSTAILRDFYMDDLLTGADSVRELIEIRDQVRNILSSGGFELHKWASNDESLLHGIPSHSNTTVLHLDKEETIKTLGLLWNAKHDTFLFSVPQFDIQRRITKRTILSDLAQVFDPLGLINPIIVSAKILMQRLWQLKLAWDETVTADIHTCWCQYRKQLPDLYKLQIPRLVVGKGSVQIELHGFCDASESAYGACVYLRAVDKNSFVSVRLVASKSRVAPLKSVSLPRLELCGAVLLAQLMKRLSHVLNGKISGHYYWTDSSIVLAWIRSQSKQWTTFVANRVGEIQRLTNIAAWRHVRTSENPSDVISRGCTPGELISNDLWWNGPSWLCESSEEWPKTQIDSNLEVPEGRPTSTNVAALDCQHALRDISRFSSLSKLIRVFAFCIRFWKNCKLEVNSRVTGPLLREELRFSKLKIVKCIQASEFSEELKALRRGDKLPVKSRLLCLDPFLDDHGVIRVGGRLKASGLHFTAKHPVLLPSNHYFTKLVIAQYHEKQFHSGLEATIAAVREEFWPIGIRSAARQIIKKCVLCARFKPALLAPKMANLSKHRLLMEKPFTNCGVDYCGPFYCKQGSRRNSPLHKAYVAVFVCCATTALHLELVSSQSTEDFIGALRRFMSRRGRVQNMYSDNGTNFVGANAELKRLQRSHREDYAKVADAFAENGLKWHFIPPNSPHFGGLWEAGVKSVKFHLRRVAGNASFTFEELYTLLVQIEGILNSRPITPISNDPNDLSHLTPGHFLLGTSPTSIPEPDLTPIRINRLSRWQRVQQICQHFWNRWQREYLQRFQTRTKWKAGRGRALQVGQMVIVRDDNLPPLKWLLGRVTAVHPGDDGIARSATIRTAAGEIKRAACRLCVLPIEGDCAEDKYVSAESEF